MIRRATTADLDAVLDTLEAKRRLRDKIERIKPYEAAEVA